MHSRGGAIIKKWQPDRRFVSSTIKIHCYKSKVASYAILLPVYLPEFDCITCMYMHYVHVHMHYTCIILEG